MTLDQFIANQQFNYLRWGWVDLDAEVHRALVEMGSSFIKVDPPHSEGQKVTHAINGSTYTIMAKNPVAAHVGGEGGEPQCVWIVGAAAAEELRTLSPDNSLLSVYCPVKDGNGLPPVIGYLDGKSVRLDTRIDPATIMMCFIWEDEVIYNIASQLWVKSERLQLPKFQSRKIVRGAKIVQMEDVPCGGVILHLEGDKQIEVSREWYMQRGAQTGGYYVVYDNGYTSWSPAEAFQGGYVRL